MSTKAKYDDLNTNQIFIVGIASIVITLVTILAVQYVYFLLVAGHQDTLQAQSSYGRQNQWLAEQTESISRYGADPDTAQVTIPIQEAMALVVREQASNAPADQPHAEESPGSSEHPTPEHGNADDAT